MIIRRNDHLKHQTKQASKQAATTRTATITTSDNKREQATSSTLCPTTSPANNTANSIKQEAKPHNANRRMKGVIALIALACTTGLVRAFSSKVSSSSTYKPTVPRARIRTSAVLVACCFFFLLASFALLLDVPGLLQTTHSDVVLQKATARLECRVALDSHDYIGAETAIRNNTLSKELYADHTKRARGSVDRVLRRINNTVLFGFGVMWPAVPPIAAMIVILLLEYIHLLFPSTNNKTNSATEQTKKKKDEEAEHKAIDQIEHIKTLILSRIGTQQHADTWSILLPLVDAVLSMGWVTYGAFYLILQERQVSDCMVISGHWFTASCTFFALLVVAVSVSTYASADKQTTEAKSLAVAYVTYTVIYVAMVLRVLINSQLFHHDNIESMQGIKAALIVMPFMAIAAITTLSFSAELVPLKDGLGFMSFSSVMPLWLQRKLSNTTSNTNSNPSNFAESVTTEEVDVLPATGASKNATVVKTKEEVAKAADSTHKPDSKEPAANEPATNEPAEKEPAQASRQRPSFLGDIANASKALKPGGKEDGGESSTRVETRPKRPSFMAEIAQASKTLKPRNADEKRKDDDDVAKAKSGANPGSLSSMLSQALNDRRAVLENPSGREAENAGSDEEWEE